MTPKTDSVAVLREMLDEYPAPNFTAERAALTAAIAALEAQGGAVAWIRFCSDGGSEGPIHDSRMEDVRKKSGAWTPLYLHPAPPGSDAVTEEMVEAAARKVAQHAGEDYDAIGEFAQMVLKDTQRSALTAALAARTGKGESDGR